MKKSFLFLSVMCLLFAGCKDSGPHVTDLRDGKKYHIVNIGNLTWTAENLNYESEGSLCYDNLPANCEKYGRLYAWEGAKNACAGLGEGWTLPTLEDWKDLIEAVGDWATSAQKLKATCDWHDNGSGTDDFGFSALPGGQYVSGAFQEAGLRSYWWTASKPDHQALWMVAHYRDMAYDRNNVTPNNYYMVQSSGLSVRCVNREMQHKHKGVAKIGKCKDVAQIANAEDAILADEDTVLTDARDGKIYRTVKIGKQKWTAENLNYESEGSLCYDNAPANCEKYGRLYAWEDAKNACAGFGGGWRLPTTNDWKNLVDAAGGSDSATMTLKSKTGWERDLKMEKDVEIEREIAIVMDVYDGTDDYGFTALPGGAYHYDYFSAIKTGGYWWTSTEVDAKNAYLWIVDYYSSSVDRYFNYKIHHYSARCVRD